MVSEPTGHSISAGENLNLSEALGRIMDLTAPLPASNASGDQEKCGIKNRFKEMIVRNNKDGNENLVASKKEKKSSPVLSKKAPEQKVNNGKTGKFRCQICRDREFSDKKRIYRHYCYAHYKKAILQLIGGDKKECPFCDKKFRDSMEMVGHVGCTHKKIEDFLPEQFHIKPESSKKTSTQAQAETGKNCMEYTCGLCAHTKTFTKRGDLYEHYSCVHFRAQLRPYIDEAGDKCPLCDLTHKQPTEYKKVRHLGVVHGMLENFLPLDLQIPKVNPHLEAVQVKTKRSSTENEITSVGSHCQPVSKFQCHLCPFSHPRRSKLYSHYAISHYHQHLLSRINLKKLDCPLCGEKKADHDSLLSHLGNTHKMVEEFLPAGFHLSRSRNRNNSKIQSSLPGKDRLHMSSTSNELRTESFLGGVKKAIDKSEPGSEKNFNKIKSIGDDSVKEEEETSGSTLKKKMQRIFGDLEDSD